MGVRFRDDVIASFRLVGRSEWWIPIDLLAGLAGYVVWVAGSAALGLQVASLADYPVAPGGTPTTPVLAVVALLWLVLPAAVGVARVRSRLMNLRGNVEQDYRFDRPAAILVPPALLVAVIGGVAVAMGGLEPLLVVVLAPVTLYLLFRTVAYSYRVYAFSHPIVPYAALFATLVVQAFVLLLYLGLATEKGEIARASVDALGLPIDPLATTEVAGLSVAMGPGIAVGLPLVLAVAYLAVQTAAALAVRVRDPTIQPSEVRTGQRYPPWLDVASNAGTTSRKSGKGTPAKKGGSGETNDASTASGSSGATASAASGTASSGDSSGTPSARAGQATGGSSSAAASAGASVDDANADEADSVSNTRVFTPPDGAGDDPLAASSIDGDEACPECGASVPGDADSCPACGADSS